MTLSSFVLQIVFRVLLISAAFVLGFGSLPAKAQQPSSDPKPSGGLFERFVSDFFNGSRHIPTAGWRTA
jgi:hypothetical protein